MTQPDHKKMEHGSIRTFYVKILKSDEGRRVSSMIYDRESYASENDMDLNDDCVGFLKIVFETNFNHMFKNGRAKNVGR